MYHKKEKEFRRDTSLRVRGHNYIYMMHRVFLNQTFIDILESSFIYTSGACVFRRDP
jgi:hypothetical protein